MKPLWQALYENGADVMLDGDSNFYERFAPQDPNGNADQNGIAEFIVGTGGASPLSTANRLTNSLVLKWGIFGALKLDLQPGGYNWQYLPAAGSVFADSGHGTCSGAYQSDSQVAAAPPAPTVSKSLTSTGQFSVSWQPSADIPSGATYSLWQRSTKSTTYSQVASGLTGTSYTFDSTNARAEGTMVFRVRAANSQLTSDYSADSSQVVVDKTAPLPPSIQTDRTAEYTSGNWWKDQVTVTFPDNGDPVLADGTPGSGVNQSLNKAPVTYSTGGVYTVSAQATDNAAWKSTTSSLTVRVDAIAPTLTLSCPSYAFYRYSRTASYTASDGESGLATPSSGTVSLDTSSRGTKTLSVSAKDRVGHTKTVSCTYTVY